MKYSCDHCNRKSDVLVVLNGFSRTLMVSGKTITYERDIKASTAPEGYYCASCRHPLLDDNGTVLSDTFKLLRKLHAKPAGIG